MSETLNYDGRVAVITGAGNGLGRSHALLLASRNARVVVNDLGGSVDGKGEDAAAADKVVAEIKAAGGDAVADYHSVAQGNRIVETALDHFGRVDIVINNAGILRDRSFHKMTDEDWNLVFEVHLFGAYKVTKAAWPHLRDQNYGRVIFTSSGSGLFGIFGQANYGAAKAGLLGFAQALAREGERRNIHVNTIVPMASSRLTESLMPKELHEALSPEAVSPLVAYLCHESNQQTGGMYEVGGGLVAPLRLNRGGGVAFDSSSGHSPEDIRTRWDDIHDFSNGDFPGSPEDDLKAFSKVLPVAMSVGSASG